MNDLTMPGKGQSAAALLQELNAEHAPLHETTEGTNVTTLQGTNNTTNVSENEEIKQGSGPTKPVAGAKRGANAQKAGEASRSERLERALDLTAEDELMVVTIRVSGKLNEYMDRYVERINRVTPKRRYRKQDAVAEAFAAFFADHPLPPAPSEDDL